MQRDAKVNQLQEEIDRRVFLEKKVQGHVKGLCTQNEMLKEFVQDLADEAEGDEADRIEKFLDNLQGDANN